MVARRRRRRRIIGLFPAAVRALVVGGRWVIRHPQPLVLSALLLGTCWGLWISAQRADLFRVARVLAPPNTSLNLPEGLIGQPLWRVDLRALSDDLQRQQPSLKAVRVVRELPDTIRIGLVQRRRVAQVRQGGRWFPVDADGFLLDDAAPQPADGLVRLAGLDRGGGALRIGRGNADERLQLALRVWRTLQRTPWLGARHVTEVDVADPRQIRFLLDGETEIRCGSEEELGVHLRRLQATLKAIARQRLDARYIDVRFAEPVVGPRV